MYFSLKILAYVIYIFTFINVNIYIPNFLQHIPTIITIMISLILMVRFNPFSKYANFTKFDKQLIFDAACFMFISILISKGYLIYITEFRDEFL